MGSACQGCRDDQIRRHVHSISQTSKANGSGTSCLKEQPILQTWRGAKEPSRLARDTKMTSEATIATTMRCFPHRLLFLLRCDGPARIRLTSTISSRRTCGLRPLLLRTSGDEC